jgi:pSer/pThr/pTyr-binding forkhead associated (FHA) protein/V8-like Glu-specific endopeptidase
MGVELRITKGARAGAKERFEKSVISIGRHPMNDLRFDAAHDLDVSARHAELRVVDRSHVLRDLGSTNGTFVNGERLTGERELTDGDVILFGADGPAASFHVVDTATAPRSATPAGSRRQGDAVAPPANASAPRSRAAPAAPAAPAAAPRRPTEVRIAEAVEAQTGRLRQLVLGLGLVTVIGVGMALWIARRAAAEGRAQVATLLAVNDSLARALERRLAQTGLADSALQEARAESERLAAELRARQASGGDVAALTAEMRAAQTRTATISRMDFAAVTATNKAAVVFIAVRMPDGASTSGTGFNVLPSGLIVTNRHVVQRADGTRADRIGVAFDGTRAAWEQAEIEFVSTTDELAFLRLVRRGTWPVVSGVARDGSGLSVGDPVAVLGYPLGTSTAGMGGDINDLRPNATLGIGTVSKTVDDTVQLDAFAAEGSSGSPVFDARGLVIGVIFGGASESNGRIVYAVPASRIAAQLPRGAAAVLR